MTPVWQDQMSLFTIANHLIRLVFPLNKDIQIQSHTFSSLQIATPKSLHWLTAEVFAHTSGVVVNISSFIWGVGYPEFVLLFRMTQQTQFKWVQVPRLAVTDRKTVTQLFLFCQNAAQWGADKQCVLVDGSVRTKSGSSALKQRTHVLIWEQPVIISKCTDYCQLMSLVRRWPLVAIVIIIATKEDVRWSSVDSNMSPHREQFRDRRLGWKWMCPLKPKVNGELV